MDDTAAVLRQPGWPKGAMAAAKTATREDSGFVLRTLRGLVTLKHGLTASALRSVMPLLAGFPVIIQTNFLLPCR